MKILAVDGNFYLHRFHSVLSANPPKDMTGAITKMFLSSICRDALLNRCQNIVVAFDGDSVFRYKTFGDYKANRTRKCGASPYDYLEDTKSFLGRMGINVFHLKKYEADDVLCSVASQNQHVVVATKDKDAYQYLREGVYLWDATHKPQPRLLKHTDIEAKFGVSPEKCVDYQILVGDAMDNVPSFVKAGKAARGLNKWGSLKNWAANDSEFRSLVISNLDALKRNKVLVTLVRDIKIRIQPIDWVTHSDVPENYIKLRDFCNPKTKGLF